MSMDVMKRVVSELLSVVVVDIVVMIISVMIRQSKNAVSDNPSLPDNERIIHQRQGLCWHVGIAASPLRSKGTGHVKRQHEWIEKVAIDRQVNTAPAIPVQGTTWSRSSTGHEWGSMRRDAGAKWLRLQTPRRDKNSIPNCFTRQPPHTHAMQQRIRRVDSGNLFCTYSGVRNTGLPIGAGQNDLFHQMFE